jgi:hypothetical protein
MTAMTAPFPLVSHDAIQPFDLHCLRDDLHVMAFFDGHPDYESVEAMISHTPRGPRTRAIITRHDQTQVDHLDDPSGHGTIHSSRAGVRTSIEVHLEPMRALVRFRSVKGEAVTLQVVAAAPPSAARGGLTDPGRHSPVSGLPLMLRGQSALAGPESGVWFDGRAFPLATRPGVPRAIGLNGAFTLDHRLLVLRAGERRWRTISIPSRFEAGEAWVTDTERFVIERVGDGALTLRSASQRVQLSRAGERLQLNSVTLLDDEARDLAALTFSSGEFSCSIGAHRHLVRGHVAQPTADECWLTPTTPSWAIARRCRLRVNHAEGLVSTTVSVEA